MDLLIESVEEKFESLKGNSEKLIDVGKAKVNHANSNIKPVAKAATNSVKSKASGVVNKAKTAVKSKVSTAKSND